MADALEWLGARVVQRDGDGGDAGGSTTTVVRFLATAEMEGVGHLQGGVLAAMLESAARLALGAEMVSTLALSVCFLRQAEPGELFVRVALPQQKQGGAVLHAEASLSSGDVGDAPCVTGRVSVLLGAGAASRLADALHPTPSLEPRPSYTASRLQQRLGPAHRFYAKQVLEADDGAIFRTSFRVRPELCAGSPPRLTAGFAAAFVQTSLGWAVQALDASGRGALVADLHVTLAHDPERDWPAPGDAVVVECSELRIGGTLAHLSAQAFVPVDGGAESFVLAEATAVCSIIQPRAPKLEPEPEPEEDRPGSLPGQRAVRDIERGPHYPRASELEVLQDEADSIRVYDEGNIRRCIRELLTSDPVSRKSRC
eukprot:COSAG04_NODE_2143_length_4696_cov_2.321242_3_plen_370_part_00